MKNRTCFIVWLPVVLVFFFCAVGGAEEAKEPEAKAEKDYLAVVNGTIITEKDLQRELSIAKKQYEAMGSPLHEAQIAQIKDRLVEMMINRELLYQAAQGDKISVDEQEVKTQFELWKKQFAPEGNAKEAIAGMGLSEEEFHAQMKKLTVIEKFIDKKFRSQISVSDEEVKKFYDSNPDFFKIPDQVKASHILIKVDENADQADKDAARKKLEGIKNKIDKEGADFAELAKEHSECPSSEKGGDLGYFRRGMMVGPFEETAFSQEPDTVSDIVETQFGYHLIKTTAKQPGGVASLEETRDNIQQHLLDQKIRKQINEYLTTLQEKADIKRKEPEKASQQ